MKLVPLVDANPIAKLLTRNLRGPSLRLTLIIAGGLVLAGVAVLITAQATYPQPPPPIYTSPYTAPFVVTPPRAPAISPVVWGAQSVAMTAWPLSAVVCGIIAALVSRRTDEESLQLIRLSPLEAPEIAKGYRRAAALKTRGLWAGVGVVIVLYLVAVLIRAVLLLAFDGRLLSQYVVEVAGALGVGAMAYLVHEQMLSIGVWAGLAYRHSMMSVAMVVVMAVITGLVTLILGVVLTVFTCGMAFGGYVVLMKAMTKGYMNMAAYAIRR